MMMMSGRSGGGGGAGRYPFTASQWQELEHQALIYKYMASGTPVPSDLILPLRRSFLLDSALATSPSLAFPPQPSQLGWGCFGMGFGRKAEDPEPGRCRRTDGKKWRCSKEAYPDSKYCEKHMHRGKNRSRKPVEMSLATPPPSSTSSASSAATTSPSSYRPSPLSISTSGPDAPAYHLLPPYASSARPSSHSPFHAQMSPFHLHLDTTHAPPPPPSSYYSSVDHKDYRYAHGARELDEHAFFSDGSERDHPSPWQFKHLGAEPKQGAPLFPGGYGNTTTTSPYAIDLSKDNEDKERQQQHCFVLGADLRLEKPSGRADDAPPQKPPRHNFFDEWPHEKSKRSSWMGLEGETQLSISIPAMAADLPITTTSRFHNDE